MIETFPAGLLQANCTLLGDRSQGVLAVIDPGGEAELIAERIAASGLEPSMILHTHGHPDHMGGTADLFRLLNSSPKVGLHRAEIEVYRHGASMGLMFGLEIDTPPEPDLWLEHGQRIELGGLSLEVRHTPGHSPGGVVFVVHGAPEPVVIAGDVLFAGGIGRTDLPGGSFESLQRSIVEQLYSLPEQTLVITGHGPNTTIGRERAMNAFVRA